MDQLIRQTPKQIVLALLLGGCLGGLVGCNESEAPGASPIGSPTSGAGSPGPSGTPTPSPIASAPEAADPSQFVISSEGVGPARLGMTLAELKQALPDASFEVRSPFIVDFDAIAVSQEGETLFYVLYLAGENFGDEGVLQGLLTDNPRYRTARGVGPGTTIAEAAQVYGAATLSYNTQNESREYVRFANHPASNLSFGTGNGNESPAGLYASPSADYNETQQYREDAAVESVLVICLTDACAVPPTSP